MDVELAAEKDMLVIDHESAGVRMTPEEFDALEEGQYEEGYRYELVDGVLVVNGIPLEQHAHPNEVLGYWLYRYQTEHPQGGCIDLTLPERYVRLANGRRLADRVVWVGLGRLPKPQRDIPTIAIEFVSRGTRSVRRDYVEKRDEYIEVGVKEYWVIDRFRRTMTVYTPSANGYDDKVVEESQVYTTPLLPGFELPLAKLLAIADRWGK